ncbi:restriction endonuclease subunit S [Halopseudomonas sp.]|uniref:restriction endonuclease subunit S n=1 Tax=Halopseudomonas sp. TaxID=2901191 RepID=UPI00311E16EE
MSASLPPGWTTCKIGQVIEFKYGKALPASIRDGAGFPVFGSNGVVGHHSSWLASAPTIVIGRKGSVGEVCFSSENCSPIDTTYYVDEFDAFNPKFCFYLLKCLDLGSLNKATAIPGLNRKDAYGLQLSLPPLAEQTRIAAKLDELLAQVDTLKARIDGIPALLKRFRQSVLAAAVSGRLTEEWRIKSSNYQDVSWPNKKLSTCCSLVTSGSRGWADYYAKEGAIFVRSQDINTDELDLSNTAFVKLPQSSEGKRTKLEVQDILLTITGANVGKVARVQAAIPEAYVSQHVALIRLSDSNLAPFIELYLKDVGSGRKELTRLAYGGGKPGLNLSNIKNLMVPCPPIEEQTEIVRRVKQLFAFADQLEARVVAAQERIDKLTQSILAKAFRGELVPQDPNDEPASVLLERIKAQRAAAPKAKRGRKTAK